MHQFILPRVTFKSFYWASRPYQLLTMLYNFLSPVWDGSSFCVYFLSFQVWLQMSLSIFLFLYLPIRNIFSCVLFGGYYFLLKLWKLFLCSVHEYFGGYVVNISSLVVHLKLSLILMKRYSLWWWIKAFFNTTFQNQKFLILL